MFGHVLDIPQAQQTSKTRDTMKLIVLASWKAGAKQEDIETYINSAPEILARGPFKWVEIGIGQQLIPNASDWGFVAEFLDDATPADWLSCQAHADLLAKVIPIKGDTASLQYD
jgi:hypothetical protein